ncbi:TFIIH subunit TTDA/Tfb5 [Pholiota molesta]|nr:TFIIH subunit TTDA/Tfb5 [Pholiota molesta]
MVYSDPAVKQILLMMNEKESFIIEDLDDHHLVIKAEHEYRIRKELETELEKNTYSLEA